MASSSTPASSPHHTLHDVAPSSQMEVGQILSGCLAWKKYEDLPKPVRVETVLKHFQGTCNKKKFLEQFTAAGFSKPAFKPNRKLSPGVPAYEKFARGLASVHPSCSLYVVFHGTMIKNIPSVLHGGLDPKYRKAQAYGPGEYFSNLPGISVSFCQGGLKMLVFVVLVVPPESCTPPPPKIKSSSQPPHCSEIPPDIVVVENNCYQIPIGTMKYKAVDKSVVEYSLERRKMFLQVAREVEEASRITKETQLKAKIIQDLIANDVAIASELYQKDRHLLLETTSEREISWYVHQIVDKDLISFYFQDLPDPLDASCIATANVTSLNEATKVEQDAKQRLQAVYEMPTFPHAHHGQGGLPTQLNHND